MGSPMIIWDMIVPEGITRHDYLCTMYHGDGNGNKPISMKHMARKIGVCHTLIALEMRKLGIPIRSKGGYRKHPTGVRPGTKEERILYRRGSMEDLNMEQISERFGISKEYFWVLAKKHNIKYFKRPPYRPGRWDRI